MDRFLGISNWEMPPPLQKSTPLGTCGQVFSRWKGGTSQPVPPASGSVIHPVVLLTSPILALSMPTGSLQPKLEICTPHCGVSHGVFWSCPSAISCSRTSLTSERTFATITGMALGSPVTSVKAGMSTTSALSPQIPTPPGSLDWTSPARCAFCGAHICTAKTSWARPTAVGAAQEPESAATSAKAPWA